VSPCLAGSAGFVTTFFHVKDAALQSENFNQFNILIYVPLRGQKTQKFWVQRCENTTVGLENSLVRLLLPHLSLWTKNFVHSRVLP
jgi:hypothetical protein